MDIKTDSDLYFFEDLPSLFQVYRLPGAAKKRRANEGFGGGGGGGVDEGRLFRPCSPPSTLAINLLRVGL